MARPARSLRIALAIGLVVAAIALGLWLLHAHGLLAALFDRQRLERLLPALERWGPPAIIIAQTIQVIISPLPGHAVGLAAGYLYGPFWGTLYCMTGTLLGSAAAVMLARRLGRPLVERWVGAERLARLDAQARTRGPSVLLLIYLIPFLPDDLCCLIAGLTPLRLSELLLVAAIGRLPGVFASVWIGAQARALTWTELLLIGAAGLTLAIIFWRHQHVLEERMFALLDRWLPRR